MELKANQYFNNRYMLIQCMGEGASAQVWKAIDLQANNLPVALKVFSSNGGMDTAGIQNFKHEFTSVFNLNHTNLLTPSSYDIYEGNPYLVMPFCESGSTAKMIGKIDEPTLLKIIHDVAAGLAYLHDNKVVHQDIKPDNILISQAGDFLISDFGISAAANVDDSVVSGFCGTKAYMGPERFNGMPAVFASDIWSLGAMAYELITGQVPFGESGGLAQSLGDKIPTIGKKLNPEIISIINACLSENPWDRPLAKNIKAKIETYWENGTWKKKSYKKSLTIVLSAIFVVAIAAGLFFIDYSRTKVRYFKDYAEYWGVPKGVHNLSKNDMKHRAQTYRFEYRHFKLQRASLVNSAGKIIPHSDAEGALDRFSDARFYYTTDGKIDYKIVYDNIGKVLYKLDYEPNLKSAILKLDDEHGTEICLGAGSTSLNNDSNGKTPITRYLLTYLDNGLVSYKEYAGFQNVSVVNDDLIHGIRYSYNDKGLITEEQYVGLDNNVRGNKSGLAIKAFEYNDKDDCVSACYMTLDRTPSNDGMGRCRYKFEYDKYGNRTREYYLTLDGQPSTKNDNGCAGVSYLYDERGNNIVTTFLDIDGNAFLTSSGTAVIKNEYNDNGFVVKKTFADANNIETESVDDGDVYGMIVYERNNVGQILSIKYFDVNGKPITLSNGKHGALYQYDDNGNNTLYSTIDTLGNVSAVNGVYAQIAHRYDARNREIERTFLNADSSISVTTDGISSLRFTYDLRGNNTKVEYLDVRGNLTLSSDMYACAVAEYDDLGNCIKVKIFDEKMNLCNSSGTAIFVNEYDSSTNMLVKESYYDKSEKLVYCEHHSYDSRANEIKHFYTDKDGKLRTGTLIEQYKYNENNWIVEESFHRLDGTLADHPNYKYAVDKRAYDDHGNRTNRSFWKADGKPAVDEINTHERIKEYDQFNNVIYEKNLGIDGKPISLSSKGTPPEIKSIYDNRGNQTEIRVFDGYGKPAIQAYHICKMTYDKRNNRTSIAYYDTNEKPIILKGEDYAKITYLYDDKNRTTEANYYGTSALKYSWKYKYNSKGKVIELSRYDVKNVLSNDESGIAKIIVEYEKNDVVPVIQKLYSAKGEYLYYSNYDKDEGEWGDFQRPAGAWQSSLRQWRSTLPQQLTDWLVLTDIQYNSYSATFTLKCTTVSIRTMSSDDINEYKEYFRNNKAFFSEDLPRNVSCRLIVLDRTGKEMFTM